MSLFSLESLSGLTAFVVSVETGSFAAAGRTLGLSASAVGKAVARLETRLGMRLLIRTTRRLSITYEGEELFARATRMMDDMREIEAMLGDQTRAPSGRVRISLPATLGRMVILPRLASFIQSHGGIELDVGLDDRKVDLVEGGIDLAVRTGTLDSSGLIARKLAPHNFVLCASPAYLARRAAPQTLDDLGRHTCIRFRYPSTGLLERWIFDETQLDRELGSGPTFNDAEAVVVAAIAGMGLAQVPDYAAHAALSLGQLVPVMPGHRTVRGAIWLVRPSHRATPSRVQVVAQFLVDVMEQLAGILTGG